MDPASLHPAAIAAAAFVSFLIGGVWYSPLLFAKRWQREAGIANAQLQNAQLARIFGGAYLCALLMAANLAAFLGPAPSLGFGLAAGAAAGFGWVAMSLGVIYLFERRSLRLWLINAGYQVLALTVMGGILAAWR